MRTRRTKRSQKPRRNYIYILVCRYNIRGSDGDREAMRVQSAAAATAALPLLTTPSSKYCVCERACHLLRQLASATSDASTHQLSMHPQSAYICVVLFIINLDGWFFLSFCFVEWNWSEPKIIHICGSLEWMFGRCCTMEPVTGESRSRMLVFTHVFVWVWCVQIVAAAAAAAARLVSFG